ncbi:MAG: iron chelate uptake ABC transporter family permease subunit [Rhizobiaceae bacterium]|nr:iron chelate uptake ABC transporter family permease subunit [Rhizobiaceae bacterium]
MANARLFLLGAALILSSLFFLFWGLSGNTWFIFELRSKKLITLITVGGAVSVATILFQTISANRILTPAIMGFDALYILLQTLLVVVIGGANWALLPDSIVFLLTSAIMVGASLLLYQFLLQKDGRHLHVLILVGVIFGLLFRSLTSFIQRLIDPSEFAMIQSTMFASFGSVDENSLIISCIIFLLCTLLVFKYSTFLDVMALGKQMAVSLGVSYISFQRLTLVVISLLVCISTALVGPITFLGLLVSALTYKIAGSLEHKKLLIISFLLGALFLVIGQTIFERLLRLQSTLSIVIEFFGGMLFLYLVLRKRFK